MRGTYTDLSAPPNLVHALRSSIHFLSWTYVLFCCSNFLSQLLANLCNAVTRILSFGMALVKRRIDEDVLYPAIEARPGLWKKGDPDYKSRIRVKQLWGEVCRALYNDFDSWNDAEQELFRIDIIQRWSNARASFRRSLTYNQHDYYLGQKLMFLTTVFEGLPEEPRPRQIRPHHRKTPGTKHSIRRRRPQVRKRLPSASLEVILDEGPVDNEEVVNTSDDADCRPLVDDIPDERHESQNAMPSGALPSTPMVMYRTVSTNGEPVITLRPEIGSTPQSLLMGTEQPKIVKVVKLNSNRNVSRGGIFRRVRPERSLTNMKMKSTPEMITIDSDDSSSDTPMSVCQAVVSDDPNESRLPYSVDEPVHKNLRITNVMSILNQNALNEEDSMAPYSSKSSSAEVSSHTKSNADFPQMNDIDHHMNFCRGLYPMVQDFDENEKITFQVGVLNIIRDIRQSRLPKMNPITSS